MVDANIFTTSPYLIRLLRQTFDISLFPCYDNLKDIGIVYFLLHII
jgi:hypothetical protein